MRTTLIRSLLFLPLFFFSFFHYSVFSQTNIRAWYADGQVWVVWEVSLPLPETYAVYAKPTTFTNTASAVLVGRLFKEEYGPGALRQQVDTAATYRIPNEQGGIYQLADNEALFVATPHQAGALFFAVTAWGQMTVTPGVNITPAAVPFSYNPAGDPVECHLQRVFPSPFAAGFTCLAYYMWADGRQNQWESRPDFPVMANAAKNGMPSLFMVSVPVGLDTTHPFPLTVWLHGGDGIAKQSLAGSRAIVNIQPKQGILVAHNDDLMGYLLNTLSTFESATRHFGWRKSYDPFTPNDLPTTTDTVVNYTQRRYRWIDDWLTRRFNVDTTRININGHSMGSKGTTAMAKAYPNHYASATVFNNGFIDDPAPSPNDVIYGPVAYQLFTNLKNESGQPLGFHTFFNLTDRVSPQRDLPFVRSFHGKNDDNGENHWGPNAVSQYYAADSIGMGMQLFWSERDHGIETGIANNDHWAYGNLPTAQTAVEDVAYEENFRSNTSFPAFFNHRLDAKNNDPGTGLIGINNGDGDNWGTWGGWHRWDWANITDLTGGWSAVAWLESNAVFANDNCPHNSLTANLAIRRPQLFKPAAGKVLNWNVKDLSNGNILQSGTATVQGDDLVVIPQVVVFKENIRRVRISVFDPTISAEGPEETFFSKMKIEPNPSTVTAFLSVFSKKETEAEVRATNLGGSVSSFQLHLFEGENRVSLANFDGLPTGFYFVEINADGGRQVVKWVKM